MYIWSEKCLVRSQFTIDLRKLKKAQRKLDKVLRDKASPWQELRLAAIAMSMEIDTIGLTDETHARLVAAVMATRFKEPKS